MAGSKRIGRPVVGYSGGVDSQLLLHLLHAGGYQPIAVHVNHHLQEAASAFEAHCRSHCHAHKIDFVCFDVAVDIGKSGIEAGAREARYRAICDWMLTKGLNELWLAHHEDDQIEGILLQLFRGSGPRGLAGMQAKGPVGVDRASYPTIRVVRPLLEFSKSVICEQALADGLSWVEDPSNRDDSIRRNWLRNTLIPELESQFPQGKSGVRKLAAFMRMHFDALDEAMSLELSNVLDKRGHFQLKPWVNYDQETRVELVRAWLLGEGVRCNRSPLLELCRQLMINKGGVKQVVAGWIVRVNKGVATVEMNNSYGAHGGE